MKTLARWLAAWACFGMLIAPTSQIGAADPPADAAAAPKAAAGPESLDLAYVPAEAVAAIVVHPQAILAGPDADWLPLEVLTAWGMKEFGFDPVKIREVIAIVAPPGAASNEPQFGAVLRFREAYSKASVTAKLQGANEIVVDGKALLALPGRGAPLLYFADDHTIVLGSAPFVKQMLAAKDVESAVTKLLKEGDASGLRSRQPRRFAARITSRHSSSFSKEND